MNPETTTQLTISQTAQACEKIVKKLKKL